MIPLAVTQPDWKAVSEFLDIKKLAGLEKSDLASFCAIIGPEDGKSNLRRHDLHYNHTTITFGAILEEEFVYQIILYDYLNISVLPYNKYERKIIMSASLYKWFEACRHFCQEKSDPEIRKLFNYIISFLKQTNMREVFNDNVETVKLIDETFVLKDR